MQERIDFSPHPKTLTMAGDYEYFAAQASSQALVVAISCLSQSAQSPSALSMFALKAAQMVSCRVPCKTRHAQNNLDITAQDAVDAQLSMPDPLYMYRATTLLPMP